jgi:putative resolvase
MSNIYTIREFAKRVNRTPTTLRRWDESGVLPAKRTAGNQRYYDESDLRKALRIELPAIEKQVIVYCRVSSQAQRADLAGQIKAMQTFCLGAGIAIDELIEEVGGGLNFKRQKFLEIMRRIEHGEIAKLVVAHTDRLVRFGFEYFAAFAEQHGCKIIVANQEDLSPPQEMVEDLMAIVHTFSCRLNGLRNYKKQIREAAEQNG